MWKKYNPNPTGRSVGDCVVRALSKALNVDWEQAYWMLSETGMQMGDMPSSNSVWQALLRKQGFKRKNLPNYCPDCYSFGDFARDNPRGIYVLGTGTHTATVIDGILYDNWNSSDETVQLVWYLD